MKKLNAQIGKIIFYLFVVAVGGWTASLTLGEMKTILPNDPITPYFALALFDGGALAWLMAWVGHARGLMQRAISAIMLVVCLAGVVLLSAGRLMDGGQTMVTASASLSAAVVYGVIGATLANLAAIYAFHVSDPDTMEEIETGLLSDTLRAEAQKQATANIESQAQELGAILAARATGQLKYNLRLPMGTEEAAQKDNFIDATARDASPALPMIDEPKKPVNLSVLWNGMVNAVTGRTANVPAVVTEAKPTEAKAGSYYDAFKQGIAQAQPNPLPVISPERARAAKMPNGNLGHTVGDVVKAGLCNCPPIVFDPNRDKPFSDEVQNYLGEVTKGNGIACLNSHGQRETWLDESLCFACPFYKSADAAKGDGVFTEAGSATKL